MVRPRFAPVDHGSRDPVRSGQQFRGRAHIAADDGRTHPAARHRLAVVHAAAALPRTSSSAGDAEVPQGVVGSGSSAAEAEVCTLDDRLRAELADEDVLEERFRAEREQRGAGSQDDDVIRAGLLEQLGAVRERGQRRPRRAGIGMQYLMRRRVECDHDRRPLRPRRPRFRVAATRA